MKMTLKQARVGAGLTQQEVASRLKVSALTYGKWEKHPEKMKIEKLVEFARITSTEVGNLIIGADEV